VSLELVLATALAVIPVIALLGFVGCELEFGGRSVITFDAFLELLYAELREGDSVLKVEFSINRGPRTDRREGSEVVFVVGDRHEEAVIVPSAALAARDPAPRPSQTWQSDHVRLTVPNPAEAEWAVKCTATVTYRSGELIVNSPEARARLIAVAEVDVDRGDGTTSRVIPEYDTSEPNLFKFRLSRTQDGYRIDPVSDARR
jgi:hypothetical protein